MEQTKISLPAKEAGGIVIPLGPANLVLAKTDRGLVVVANAPAADLGVAPGMTGRDALLKF